MQLHHIAIVPIEDSLLHGALSIELSLGGQLSASLQDVVTIVDRAVLDNNLQRVLIVLDGRVPALRDAEEIFELAQILRSKGYYIIGKTDGNSYPKWFPVCNQTLAMVTNEPWMNFTVNEIEYIPPMEGALIEPTIANNNANAVCSMKVNRNIPTAVIFNFAVTAKRTWNIISEPKRAYTLLIVGGN